MRHSSIDDECGTNTNFRVSSEIGWLALLTTKTLSGEYFAYFEHDSQTTLTKEVMLNYSSDQSKCVEIPFSVKSSVRVVEVVRKGVLLGIPIRFT